MRLKTVLALLFVCSAVFSEEGGSLRIMPVALTEPGVVTSYDILVTENLNRLVVELQNETGMVSYQAFDVIGDTLEPRPVGSEGLPARFLEPLDGQPEVRRVAGGTGTGRFWSAGGKAAPRQETQLVTALDLIGRRFSDVSDAPYPEFPPASAGLSVDYIMLDAVGEVMTVCLLEPNLLRRGERMTAVSATWVAARGAPHLLVGMTVDAGESPWPLFYRLYSQEMELVAQTEAVVFVSPGSCPQPAVHDLTGDGSPEVIVFSTSEFGPALAVLRTGSGDPAGHRVLSLNDCAVRMNGPDVVAVQRALQRLTYDLGVNGVDGWYGPDTRAAVVAFQRDHGLLVTGVVDDATWAELGLR